MYKHLPFSLLPGTPANSLVLPLQAMIWDLDLESYTDATSKTFQMEVSNIFIKGHTGVL